MAIGENLNRLRRDKGWNQEELANRAGISLGQVSKIERNKDKPKLDTIYSLINAIGCSPNALLNDVKETSTNGRLEMALERLEELPENEKEVLINLIDKYCLAVAYQKIGKNNPAGIFNFGQIRGETEELSK